MATLTVTTFVTLDGVMQAPGGPGEDPSGGFDYEGWLVSYGDQVFMDFIADLWTRPTAFLLGRKTYEIFASYWPRMTDPADPIAGKLNALPKFVATKSLRDAAWNNTTLLHGDLRQEVEKLKRTHEGEVQVHGSGELVQSLLTHGLVDAFNVMTFPLVLGKGKRLFGSGTVPLALTRTSIRETTTGATLATYRPAGLPKTGTIGQPG